MTDSEIVTWLANAPDPTVRAVHRGADLALEWWIGRGMSAWEATPMGRPRFSDCPGLLQVGLVGAVAARRAALELNIIAAGGLPVIAWARHAAR